MDQIGVGSVPIEQLRPQQDVLAGVVHVQARQDQPGMRADNAGPRGVAGSDLSNQLGDQDELAPEYPMDDVHVTDIGELLRGDI